MFWVESSRCQVAKGGIQVLVDGGARNTAQKNDTVTFNAKSRAEHGNLVVRPVSEAIHHRLDRQSLGGNGVGAYAGSLWVRARSSLASSMAS